MGVYIAGQGSGICRGYGLSAGEGIEYPDRLAAVYFSIVTITTLGYGDFSPRQPLRLLAAMEAVSGLIVFGIFVGLIAHSLNRVGDKAGATNVWPAPAASNNQQMTRRVCINVSGIS
ncbi:potassium channel family protein, partial [Marivibrio halodurans]